MYCAWLREHVGRSQSIFRPTVVFGERNRGIVYRLLAQVAKGAPVMIGPGRNRKSMVYVENVAAFLEFCMQEGTKEHVYNFVDTPDLDMNELGSIARRATNRDRSPAVRIP